MTYSVDSNEMLKNMTSHLSLQFAVTKNLQEQYFNDLEILAHHTSKCLMNQPYFIKSTELMFPVL